MEFPRAMLAWFRENAPIRRKFDILLLANLLVIAVPVTTTALAARGAVSTPVLMAAAIAALLAGIVVGLIAKHQICTPYVATVVRMEGLAAGDLTTPIHYTGFTDCVGRMTRAMDVFRRNGEAIKAAAVSQEHVVGALGTGLSRVAVSDLGHRITTPFPEGYERLRIDYNRAMDAVTAALTAVSDATGGINAGVSGIHQASDDLSHRTRQQVASLQATTVAMDEITATVGRTATGAIRVNMVVGEARREAEQSGDVVRRTVGAMSGIERASAEITDIISVIDGIAFQTNLLALNAGVEAARAGDAGRGFAVVASEVRALAQRSADAAKDVKANIIASSEQVEAGVALVNETGQALQRIIGRIGEIDELVGAIVTSAQQQTSGLQQVNMAVAAMDAVTQQNAVMVEETNAAARGLAAETEQLAQEIGRFTFADRACAATSPMTEKRLRTAA